MNEMQWEELRDGDIREPGTEKRLRNAVGARWLSEHPGLTGRAISRDDYETYEFRAPSNPTPCSPAPAAPWVRASERQPDHGVLVPTRAEGGAWRGCVGREPIYGGLEWLDIDAVDRLAGEVAELRERLASVADCGQSNANEALKWRGRCADAERNADHLARSHAILLDRIADLERERDELRDRYEAARSVADRAETAARDAADRLAAYATPKPFWD